MNIRLLAGAAALLLSSLGAAYAGPNLVTNGNFEQSTYKQSHQFGTGYGGQGVTGWTANGGYNLYFLGGTATTVGAYTVYGSAKEKLWSGPGFTGSSPDGGNFVALDGDQYARGSISQMLHGLTVGTGYTVAFDWGAGQVQSRTGITTEQFAVSLGDKTMTTAVVTNPSKSFTGWMHETFTFTADSTSELLNFLSIGTPTGLPPIAVLDGVSVNQVPEPASIALLGVGLIGLAARSRRRRAA